MIAQSKYGGKKVTIDSLAVMVKNGFESVETKIRDMRQEMNGVKDEMQEVKGEMRGGFAQVHKRLDRIEHIILVDHGNRINRMEDRVRFLETKK